MALIDLPGLGQGKFKTVRWELQQPSQVNRSGWSGARKVVVVGAPVWRVQAQVIPITRIAQALPWRAFFAALQGRANTFRMPAFNAPGNVDAVVDASGPGVPGGSSVIVKAIGAPNMTLAKAGSYATIPLDNNTFQMVMLTADAITNGAALAQLDFKPALRRAAVPTSPVYLAYPFCEMAMLSDAPSWEGMEGQQFSFSLEAEEAF